MDIYCFWLVDIEKDFSSEIAKQNALIFYIRVFCNISLFCPDPSTNMAVIGNSCFWLANQEKISFSKIPMPIGIWQEGPL